MNLSDLSDYISDCSCQTMMLTNELVKLQWIVLVLHSFTWFFGWFYTVFHGFTQFYVVLCGFVRFFTVLRALAGTNRVVYSGTFYYYRVLERGGVYIFFSFHFFLILGTRVIY